jgi:hypothetical protein
MASCRRFVRRQNLRGERHLHPAQVRAARGASPRKILEVGWDKPIAPLDRGGYARYDFKAASKSLNVNFARKEQCRGERMVVVHGAWQLGDHAPHHHLIFHETWSMQHKFP